MRSRCNCAGSRLEAASKRLRARRRARQPFTGECGQGEAFALLRRRQHEQLGAEYVEIPGRTEAVRVVAQALLPGLGEGGGQHRRERLEGRAQPPQRHPDLMNEFHRLLRVRVGCAGDVALPLPDAGLGQRNKSLLHRLRRMERRGFGPHRLRAVLGGVPCHVRIHARAPQ